MTTRTVLAALLCATVVLAGCAGFGIGGGDGTATPGADTTETTATTTETTTEEPTTTDTTVTATEPTTTTTTTEVPTTTEDDTTTTEPTPTTSEITAVETTEELTTTQGSDTTMAMPTTVTTPGGTSAPGGGAFQFLAFEQPGTYTYEVTFVPTVSEQQGTQTAVTRQGQNQSAEYVIDVVQASENQYEVQVSLSMTGMSNEQTFTGTRQEVQQQMLSSQVGVFLAPLTTMTGFYGGRSLQVGQSWSYSSQQEMVSFEVTGTDSYAGVDCFVSEASVNGTVVHEACVSPDRGLAPYAAYYNENGTLTFEMELTSYEPG